MAQTEVLPPAAVRITAAPPPERPRPWWAQRDLAGTALVAIGLCLVTFVAGGGLNLGPLTRVEMALTLGGGVVIAGVALLRPGRGRSGLWPVMWMLVLAALTAWSIIWSANPDLSWQEAGRTLAYTAVFAGAVATARAAPDRWRVLLGGIVVSSTVICGWALLTKVFPSQLNAAEIYARLRAPYDYWNAIGLTASIGTIAALWLGARRGGRAALNALAYPAIGLMLVTLLLAYSRGALIVLGIGLLVWFTAVPLRLRGAVVLLVSAAAAAVVIGWDFSKPALTQDHVALAARASAGHELGVLLVAMCVALLVAGAAVGIFLGRTPPRPRIRWRYGAGLICAVALVPVVVVAALALSHRGLTGTISHDFDALTSLNPHVSNSPGRLTAVGSVRALYWDQASKVWSAHESLGTGAGAYGVSRLRFANDTLNVQHAHGYVVQTMSDLGLVGLAISIALLIAWALAAARSSRPWGLGPVRLAGAGRGPLSWRLQRERLPHSAERVGLLTLLCIAICFGAHSAADWTWFVPGNAVVGLLCAGWLAGRGPAGAGAGLSRDAAWDDPPRRDWREVLARMRPAPAFVAVAAIALALIGAWSQWQPLRSSDADAAASAAIDRGALGAALQHAQTAVARDRLSETALLYLADVQARMGNLDGAQATLQKTVRLQPANPDAWMQLAAFYETQRHDPRRALAVLRSAVYLNPSSQEAQGEYVYALRLLNGG